MQLSLEIVARIFGFMTSPRFYSLRSKESPSLAIINHQRNLPALQRQRQPFQPDVLTNATEQGFGLLTGWDLFKLVRGISELGWNPEHVGELFYLDGRIDPVPLHYEYVGTVDGFWPQAGAIGVRVDASRVSVGDVVAYELPTRFLEDPVTSLQIDGAEVEAADVGDYVGALTSLDAIEARRGIRVFRVKT